jgi:hypothetical protein
MKPPIGSIAKITIEWESKWHLKFYTFGEYDYEEDYSVYCETLEECCEQIRQFQP